MTFALEFLYPSLSTKYIYSFLLSDLHNYDFKAFPGILLSYRCKVKLKLGFIVIHYVQLNRYIDINVSNDMYFNKLSNS